MASIRGCNFIFANHSSEELGLIKCDIGEIDTSGNDESSDIILSTTSSQSIWNFHGIKKSTPTTFPFVVCQPEGGFMDNDKERQIKKILVRKNNFNWLSFDQDDMMNIAYYVIMNNPQKVNIARETGGLKFDCTCDHQGAWTTLKTKSLTTVNGGLLYKMILDTDDADEIIRPSLIITPTTTGNISIKNTTRNETVTLNNCVIGENIILDGNNCKIKATNGLLLDRWNKYFIRLQDGVNNLELIGNFSLKINYRLPIRVGG
jgi:hypothetical protein